jgi:hypothetical protein
MLLAWGCANPSSPAKVKYGALAPNVTPSQIEDLVAGLYLQPGVDATNRPALLRCLDSDSWRLRAVAARVLVKCWDRASFRALASHPKTDVRRAFWASVSGATAWRWVRSDAIPIDTAEMSAIISAVTGAEVVPQHERLQWVLALDLPSDVVADALDSSFATEAQVALSHIADEATERGRRAKAMGSRLYFEEGGLRASNSRVERYVARAELSLLGPRYTAVAFNDALTELDPCKLVILGEVHGNVAFGETAVRTLEHLRRRPGKHVFLYEVTTPDFTSEIRKAAVRMDYTVRALESVSRRPDADPVQRDKVIQCSVERAIAETDWTVVVMGWTHALGPNRAMEEFASIAGCMFCWRYASASIKLLTTETDEARRQEKLCLRVRQRLFAVPSALTDTVAK